MTDDAAAWLTWTDDQGQAQRTRWRSLAGHPAPQRVVLADDRMSASTAFGHARAGTGLLWRGDYQNARQMLQAMARRLDAQGGAKALSPRAPDTASLREAFGAQRRAQAQRAQVLGLLLLPFDADHGLPLRRAPDVRAAGAQAHGPVGEHYVESLRELLGLIGAFEWRRNGVPIAALDARIHPQHGVFSPIRGEYVDLILTTPLPAAAQGGGAGGGAGAGAGAGAFDIGTGTGVLAAVLARRGLRVIATDNDPRALACAQDNLARLGLAQTVTVLAADLFPPGQAGLVVCNPPWVPVPAGLHAGSALEAAVYDPDSQMLRGFLAGLAAHLVPGGEGWLVLSDLAEHLGLRSRSELLGWIAASGLRVLGRHDVRPRHGKATDATDPLHAARSVELTSLWRLGAANGG